MVKCPFCQFENEEGALFCEQCKSDLGSVEAVPVHMGGHAAAEGGAGAPPEGVPVAALIDEPPPAGEVPHAAALEHEPLMHEPLADVPVAAPIAESSPAAAFESPPALSAPPAPATAPPGAEPAAGTLAADAKPRLIVMRGLKINVEYPLYEGHNFIGRADEKPVDIDLEDQEPPDRIWSSRQHALITFESGALVIEDLNSSNGTFVNRTRIYPGQKRPLQTGDMVQIGTVQMKVKV